MRKFVWIIFLSIMLFPSRQLLAADPMEIYKGNRGDTGYPRVEELGSSSAGSTKVKMSPKEVYPIRSQASRSSGQEAIPMKGILSKDGKIIHQEGQAGSDEGQAETEENPPACLGTWQKIDFYVGGEPHPFDPATITLNKDSFSSSSPTCSAAGKFSATDASLTMIMTSTDCPGNIPLPYTSNYQYEVTEDGKKLTYWNNLLKEIFVRKE